MSDTLKDAAWVKYIRNPVPGEIITEHSTFEAGYAAGMEASQAALVKARELAEEVTQTYDCSYDAPSYFYTARELLKLLPEVKP